jgi:hypothetical protein
MDGSLQLTSGTVPLLNKLIAVRKAIVDQAFLDAIEAASSNLDAGSKKKTPAKTFLKIAQKVFEMGM